VVFLLFGAAAGYWMANRIGDPVLRLTRASQRIASGELSVRVFVRTADELQRLVESFNTMAHELEQQRVQLERTNRLEAWAEMARQVAHDIKNPLTPIQLATEHLRRVHHDRGEPLAPVLNQCVETILTQVKLLRRISSDFANFASSPAPTFEPTDIAVLVREILDGYRLGLDARVSVTSSIAEGLAVLPIDRLLVGRALTNVIENALQAVASGGTVGVTVAEESGGVVMRVTDTGPGLDPATSARAFEPYFSTKMSGTGLGLPIARRNIELHGGHVSISSAPGEGTTVSLVLPRPGAATA
jgi:two-component system nitrogen regulation sensor histidine kinase NtrY